MLKITQKFSLKKSLSALHYLCSQFAECGLSYRSAALAYATLLAIVPLLIIMIRIFALFPAFAGIDTEIQNLIINNFVAQSANTISAHLQSFLSHVHKLSHINLAFLVLIDILMIYNIHEAFNAVWKTELELPHSLSFLMYLLVLVCSPLLFGGILVLAGFIYKLHYIQQLLNSEFIRIALPYLISLTTFTLLNWILPWRAVGFKAAFIAGTITTIIFESAKAAFVFYLNYASTYRVIYGAMAILPIFLLWLYVSWLIILLGALITRIIKTGIPRYWYTK